jgi:hypothetical protein
MAKHGSQFNSSLDRKAIYGRIARMWASFIREWHSYFILKEAFDLDFAEVMRNYDLDFYKGIDVYIKNLNEPTASLKIDVMQDTKRSNKFRRIKDTRRIKGQSIPGVNYRVSLGQGVNTKTIKDVNKDGWYLISNQEVEKIKDKFLLLSKVQFHPHFDIPNPHDPLSNQGDFI